MGTRLDSTRFRFRFAFGRSSKGGSERHLREALRKSESAPSASHDQRYTKLPTSRASPPAGQPPTLRSPSSPSPSSAPSTSDIKTKRPERPAPGLKPVGNTSNSHIPKPPVGQSLVSNGQCPPAPAPGTGAGPPPPRPTTSHPGMSSASKGKVLDEAQAASVASAAGGSSDSGADGGAPAAGPSEASGGASSSRANGGSGGPCDWGKSGSFINKPPRGWLHPDAEIAESGIRYTVRYVGCLEINTSMRSLDFETRSQIAKECINRVCESGGLKTADKKRRTDKRICKMLAESPNMAHAGCDVRLTITSSFLNLTVMGTEEIIAKHEMPNISFASGGDAETLDFVAYVAKDHRYNRACFVLECGGGSAAAQDVITTIGQAFELRFKEFLKRTPRNVSERLGHNNSNSTSSANLSLSSSTSAVNGKSTTLSSKASAILGAPGSGPGPDGKRDEDRDYYNDLPGKLPPETLSSSSSSIPVEAAVGPTGVKESLQRIQPQAAPRSCLKKVAHSESASSDHCPNLIDLNTDLHQPNPVVTTLVNTEVEPKGVVTKKSEPEYVNYSASEGHCDLIGSNNGVQQNPTTSSISLKDPFDMQPFNSTLEQVSRESLLDTTGSPCTEEVSHGSDQRSLLEKEIWFHGAISRHESEALVVNDGDFLVRESQGSAGQYVLTGIQGTTRKHLLLVDPEGVVRTKEKTFESVSHLINYHRDKGLPIISAESALVLRNPVKARL